MIDRIDSEIAKTNRYLMGQGEEPVPDPRAIEMVREIGKYAKRSGVPVSNYVNPGYDVDQLTKLLAKGVTERELIDFYERTIKGNIDEDLMPRSENEAFERFGEFLSYFDGRIEVDSYSNSDLGHFFNLPAGEKRSSYLQKVKRFAKKLAPVLAAGIVLSPVAAAADNVTSTTNNTIAEYMYDDTQEWFTHVKGKSVGGEFCWPENFMSYIDGFKAIDKSLYQPIKAPDNVMKMLEATRRYDDKSGGYRFGPISVAPTDLAVWVAAGFEMGVPKTPQRLVYLDIDNDNKPEVLMPTIAFKFPIDDDTSIGKVPKLCTPILDDYRYCVLDAFNTNYRLDMPIGPVEKLLYTNKGWEIVPRNENFTIGWKEVVGKIPIEIGLDADNRAVFDFSIKEIPEAPVKETPETPGFELAALGAAGLAAYFAAKHRKYKNQK